MNDPIGFVVCTIGLFLLMINAFIVWVKPKTYLEDPRHQSTMTKKTGI